MSGALSGIIAKALGQAGLAPAFLAGIGWILLAVVVLIVYFIPAMVAFARGHHNAGAILLLNLLLGWSFVGWAVALVWAATRVREEPSRYDYLERKDPR